MTTLGTSTVAPEVRASWERFVAARQRAERTLLFCDSHATAGAFFGFLGIAGGITRVLALIGPLIAPDDPIARLLWRLASRCRPTAGARP